MSSVTPMPAPNASSGRRFELVERLGAGAFGEVYLANQVSNAGFSRRVAIKLLHPSRFDEDDAARRIRDEARVLGRLHHPHIVTVMDLVRLETQWAVVMEHVDGADLEHVLKALSRAGRVFPTQAVMELVSAVADALDAAHNAEGPDGRPLRVVHRDIKPANLRVTPNGHVKVLDFGIARARQAREAETGAYVIGTQRYMAPERIAGRDHGSEGDVYSLAATAFELITGEALGRSPVLTDRHARFLQERLLGLDRRMQGPPDVTRRVAGLLFSCLQGEALDRPRAADVAQQAGELAKQLGGEDLRAFCRRFVPQVPSLLGHQRDVVSGVLTERTSTRAPDPGEPDTLRQSTGSHEVEPVRSWWLPLIGAASAVVIVGALMLLVGLLGGVGAWLWLRPEPVVVEPAAPVQMAVPVVPLKVTPVVRPSVEPRDAEPVPTVRPRRVPAPEPSPVVMVSRALVSAPGAQAVTVVCGPVKATGTSSARIMDFPGGDCVISAVFAGREVSRPFQMTAPRTVTCASDGETLSCD